MSEAMNRNMEDNFARVIYNIIPIKRRMTLTIDEFKSLINYFDYGHPHRLCFLLMGCYGLRSMEVTSIKLQDLKDECKTLTYVIGKKNNVKKYVTGTKSVTRRTRTVKIFESLRRELLFYVENNYHLFKDRQVFPFTKDSLRRYLSKLRSRAVNNKIGDPVLSGLLLDCESERYGFGLNVQPAYRFTLHSFRRFYLTYYYHTFGERDIVLTQLEIGHELKDTTMVYVKRPGDIGLTKSLIDKKLDFESLLYKCDQLTIGDFK
jgi:integrase